MDVPSSAPAAGGEQRRAPAQRSCAVRGKRLRHAPWFALRCEVQRSECFIASLLPRRERAYEPCSFRSCSPRLAFPNRDHGDCAVHRIAQESTTTPTPIPFVDRCALQPVAPCEELAMLPSNCCCAPQRLHHPAIEEQPDSAVYWMSMHADLESVPARVLRPELIDEISTTSACSRASSRSIVQRPGGSPTSCSPRAGTASTSAGTSPCSAMRSGAATARGYSTTRAVRARRACVPRRPGRRAHTIALVQGRARGGFEAALSCHTIVAEEGSAWAFGSAVRPVPRHGRLQLPVERISSHQAEA